MKAGHSGRAVFSMLVKLVARWYRHQLKMWVPYYNQQTSMVHYQIDLPPLDQNSSLKLSFSLFLNFGAVSVSEIRPEYHSKFCFTKSVCQVIRWVKNVINRKFTVTISCDHHANNISNFNQIIHNIDDLKFISKSSQGLYHININIILKI